MYSLMVHLQLLKRLVIVLFIHSYIYIYKIHSSVGVYLVELSTPGFTSGRFLSYHSLKVYSLFLV